jgi:RHS repeat-associated protein
VTTSYDMDVSSGTPGTGDLEGMSASVTGTQVFSASYVRDELGRIERLDETVLGTSLTRKYEYDGAGRLVTVLDGSDAVISEYEYDGNGARVRALTPSGEVELGTDLGCGVGLTTPVDAQDRLCRYGDYEYVYDDNGRLFSKTQLSTSEETQYTYDGLGRLRSVTLPDTTRIGYVHDALGRRVGKVMGDGVTGVLVRGWRYGMDSLQPLAQLDSAGRIEKTFVYGTRANVPELIIDHVSGATYRVIVDHLGSVRLIVNVATGAVAQQMAYDEFGNVTTNVVSLPGFSQPFGFAGGLYDADTGLVRFGVRDYDAVTGRWTAKDPILFEGGTTNLYDYVNGDPINKIDPSGEVLPGDKQLWCELAAASWGIACAVTCTPSLGPFCPPLCVAAALALRDACPGEPEPLMCEDPRTTPDPNQKGPPD